MTVADRSIEEPALTFHINEKPLNVSHSVAGPFQSISHGTDDAIFTEISRQDSYIERSVDS
jgi:hypothetical protein